MQHPGRGAPFSVRTLAEAAGIPAATVGHLVSGRVSSCDMQTAHALTEALGVAVLVLFAPPPSPNQTVSNPTEHPREEEPCRVRAPHPA